MPLHLHLCDRNTPLYIAWQREFQDQALCTVHLADFFSVEADILVSGGNGLGFFDVGLELAIALKLGLSVPERLQALLREEHGGGLAVGQAVSVPTLDPRWPLLLYAPTMWVPMDVSMTIHPYLAARAAFRLFRQLEQAAASKVWHMLMPGLGTGQGRTAPQVCALQMRRAYEEVILGRAAGYATLDQGQRDYTYLVSGGGEATPA